MRAKQLKLAGYEVDRWVSSFRVGNGPVIYAPNASDADIEQFLAGVRAETTKQIRVALGAFTK